MVSGISAWIVMLSSCSLVLPYPDERSESSSELCADGTDNDFNGRIDCDDPRCDGHCPEQGVSRCTDGRDNDGDGLKDDFDPRCWPESPRQVVRCSSQAPIVFAERFDGGLSASRWTTFGEASGQPVVETQAPAGRDGRTDYVFGAASSASPASGGAVSTQVFDGEWATLDLSFSATLMQGGYLSVELVPVAMAPADMPPTDGAESASVVISLDARDVPRLTLASSHERRSMDWTATSWTQVRLSASAEQLVLEIDGQPALQGSLPRLGPARLVLRSTSDFWASGLAPAQVDDVRLALGGERQCSTPSPSIPLGATCRQHPSKLERDVGFTVSVASRSNGSVGALLTDAPTGSDHPTSAQFWHSPDGETWDPGAALPASWGGTLTGASLVWDDGSARYRAAVGVQHDDSVQLMVGTSLDGMTWDAFRDVAVLEATAEAPSYVLPGVVAGHEIYVTYPASESSGRSLWRLRSSDGEQFALESEPVAVFDQSLGVAAPVSISSFGPKDLIAIHPIAPNAGASGLGLLVASSDDMSQWTKVLPWPVLEPGGEPGGFDDDGLVAGTLAFHQQRALLLFAARGQPLPSVVVSGGSQLTASTAWLESPSDAVPSPSSDALPPACGDGVCDPSDSCEVCPVDCGPCDGSLTFAETFSELDAWQLVAPLGDGAEKPFYRVPGFNQLNLDPHRPGWLTRTHDAFAGDFELSFDVQVVAPSSANSKGCTAYVGVGEAPSLLDMDPRGVFVRIDQHLVCSDAAPAFSARVRTGEAEVASSLTGNDNACSGAAIGLADAWHHVALRRENGVASVRIWGPDGCEISSDAQVPYRGALPSLDTVMVGLSSAFGDKGWESPCADGTGAISLDNVVLRTLPCAETSETCQDELGRVGCVDTNKSPEHCGGCFQPVGAAEACEAGMPLCQGAWCSNPDTGADLCVDVQESAEHCGACGTKLTEHEVCRGGMRQAKMVLLPPGFLIDSTEVTRAQYASWLATAPALDAFGAPCDQNLQFTPQCGWPPGDRGDFPVRCVDWCDAFSYCKAVGKHLCGRIGGGPHRTTAEWDKPQYDQWNHACTSGGLYDFTYGDDYDPEACSESPVVEVASSPTCQSPATGYEGVYDLCGSASEWTLTCGEDGTKDQDWCRQRLVAGTTVTDKDCGSTWLQPRGYTSAMTGFRCCAL